MVSQLSVLFISWLTGVLCGDFTILNNSNLVDVMKHFSQCYETDTLTEDGSFRSTADARLTLNSDQIRIS